MLAFEKVAAKHNDAKLLIVGGQSFSNNVKDDYVIDLEFIASRIGNGVIFTGYVDYSEITSYLQLSTIVVVPSTSFEASPFLYSKQWLLESQLSCPMLVERLR